MCSNLFSFFYVCLFLAFRYKTLTKFLMFPPFCSLHYPFFGATFFPQIMKPVYQSCMEKGIQHVATHATEYAISGGASSPSSRSGAGSRQMNGKVKRSWEYASGDEQQQQQQQLSAAGRQWWRWWPADHQQQYRRLPSSNGGNNNTRFSGFFDNLRGNTGSSSSSSNSNVKRSIDTADSSNGRTVGRVIRGQSQQTVGSSGSSAASGAGIGLATKPSGRRRTKK